MAERISVSRALEPSVLRGASATHANRHSQGRQGEDWDSRVEREVGLAWRGWGWNWRGRRGSRGGSWECKGSEKHISKSRPRTGKHLVNYNNIQKYNITRLSTRLRLGCFLPGLTVDGFARNDVLFLVS